MITDNDRKILRPVIGETYTPQVLKILNSRGITNNNGNPFSSGFIRQVFLGLKENLDVEMCFFDLRDEILKKQEKLKERRKAIAGH